MARRMAESFVPLIEQVLKADNPEKAADKAGKIFKGALLALARKAEKIKGKRDPKFPEVALLIRLAQMFFEHDRERPRKSLLKYHMQILGYSFKGKDVAGNWRDLFLSAGLDKLPE